MFSLMFLKKGFHVSIAYIVILTIQPLHAGETHLLSKQQPEQRKGAFCLTQQSYKEESEAVSEPQSFIRKLTSYVSSKASALRNPWGANDLLVDLRKLAYSTEDFQDDIASIVTSGDYSVAKYLQLRLEKLQDHVWKGEISPYVYYQGLKELEPYVGKADLSLVRKEFERKVTTFQPFVDNNFQRDLLNALEEIRDTSSLVGFEELLSYYGTLENSFDYGTTLTQFGEWVVRNGQLREDHLKALYSMIVQNLGQIDRKKYKKIESERSSVKRVLEELPFYNESLPKGFNSSLPSKVQPTNNAKESSSFGSVLKGLAYALYKGTRYAVNHPRQIFVLGLAAHHIVPVVAQTGSEFIINQNTTRYQQSPSVSGLTNGNLFVAWVDGRSGTYYDIYGRVFFPNGTALGSDFIINNQNTTSNQLNPPSVSGLGNGNAFVVWQGTRAGNYDIYGRVFFPNGTALGGDFIINQITTNIQWYPSISGLSNGNVFVAWEDYRSGTDTDIYGRVFFSNGTALGGEFIINQNTTSYQQYPKVTELTNSNVFVAWQDSSYSDIYGRVFFSNGTALGSDFIINQNTTNNQLTPPPSVSGLSTGNVFVAWGELRSGTSFDIYGRVFFPNGTALGGDFIITQITTNYQEHPSVTGLTNGNVLVVWDDARSGTDTDIYGRVFFPNGTTLGSEFIINQITTNSQQYPAVSALTNGNVFVAWEGYRSFTYDIYGRIFTDLDLAALSQIGQFASSNVASTLSMNSVVSTDISALSSGFPTYASSSSGLRISESSSSEFSMSASILSSSLSSSSPSPSSTGISEGSSSSLGLSRGTSWQTTAVIGGTVGGAGLIGISAAVIVAKKCSSKRKSDIVTKVGSDIELNEKSSEGPTVVNRETPASSQIVSPFEETYKGFTEHPTFVGKFHRQTYEIWKSLSQEEAELIRPMTSIPIPTFSSDNIDFILGKGHFGATYVGSNPQNKEVYAIKEVYGLKAVEESLREGEIVHSLGAHTHIMPLIDYIHFAPSKKSQKPRLLQVMPLAYINGAGFKEMLTHSSAANRERLVSDSLRQMMMGLEYLHKEGVVHLDIKADNTLYMKDGTLKIADFGRAQQVGKNDQIATMDSLGDMRKFSPEIVAFIRKCKGGTFDTVEWFSGKRADVWAAGLYGWELLEDNEDNLYSTKSIPLMERVNRHTYEAFEQFVGAINALNKNYSPKLLTLLGQVLAVNPEMRLKTSQVLKMLSQGMRANERERAFEEVIKVANSTAEEKHPRVYVFADPKMYLEKSDDQGSPVDLPNSY